MKSGSDVRTRWVRKVSGEVVADCARRGVKPKLVCERGSGLLAAELKKRGIRVSKKEGK